MGAADFCRHACRYDAATLLCVDASAVAAPPLIFRYDVYDIRLPRHAAAITLRC